MRHGQKREAAPLWARTMAAIQLMLDGPHVIFIPGHGRSGGREVPAASLRFLEKLNASVTKYFKAGMASYEMKDQVIADMAEFKDWHNFNEMGRVIAFVHEEIERSNF